MLLLQPKSWSHFLSNYLREEVTDIKNAKDVSACLTGHSFAILWIWWKRGFLPLFPMKDLISIILQFDFFQVNYCPRQDGVRIL